VGYIKNETLLQKWNSAINLLAMGVHSGYRLLPDEFLQLETVLNNKYLTADFLTEHVEEVIEGLQMVVAYAKQVVNEPNTIATAVAHTDLTAVNRAELKKHGVCVLPNTVSIVAHYKGGIIEGVPEYYTIQHKGD
jgi:hypothetical protein